MATITPKTDKSGNVRAYKVTLCVGRDEQYKQVWRTCVIPRPEGLTPAKERKEVERLADAWAAEQKDEYDRSHEKIDKTKITFDVFVRQRWLADHVHGGTLTPSTAAFYEHMAESLIDYFGKKRLASIDAESIKHYVKYLNTEARTKTGAPISQSTAKHLFETLRNILRYAARFQYIPADPTMVLIQTEKPHTDKQEIRFLDEDKARKFVSALEDESLFLKCLLGIMIQTGLRRGEAVGLQWGDIDAKNMTMTIQRNVTVDKQSPDKIHIGTTKGKDSRTVPLPETLYSQLVQLKAEQEATFGVLLPTAFVFASANNPYHPIYATTPTLLTSRFIKRHGLAHVSPHILRHTFASMALHSGANMKQVQTVLGHRDIATTLRYYTGIMESAKRDAVEGVDALLKTNAAK